MSTQADQNPKVKLKPRFEHGRPLLIAGLRKRVGTSARIPGQWERVLTYKIPKQVGRVGYGVCFNCLGDTGRGDIEIRVPTKG